MRYLSLRLMILVVVFGLLAALPALAEDPDEATYDPGDDNEYGETDPTPQVMNHHRAGAFSGGLFLGYMTWPRQDEDGDPYGNDAGGILVGLRGQYYFVDNLAAFANIDFSFGEYTMMTRVALGAQYNIPISTDFTAFVGAGLALDMGSWDEFPYEDREDDDPDNRNAEFYQSGDRTNVGFNATGGIEFFLTEDISLRPAVGLDFAGSLHLVFGLGASYYL
ncbi:MAG: hypothetical protein GF403_11095 [Candidatus Coatesbacteria bacterium]|nr:hypothetical protein [Candidatus Coatesbacteria bacterium]